MEALFTTHREVFLAALAQIRNAIERRNTIPILANMLIAPDEGGLVVKGTDLDVMVAARCPAETAGFATTTLPAGTLYEIVGKLPQAAKITVESDGQAATIRAGRSRFKLPVLPASDWPDMSESGSAYTHGFTLPAAELARALDTCAFAVSTEETRFYLNGIFMHAAADGGEDLVFVATDGHRLARATLDRPGFDIGADLPMPGIIIPRKAVRLLQRALKSAKETAEATVRFNDARIEVAIDGTVLTSKLIDGTFPDYQRVVPTGNNLTANLPLADLRAALERVAVLTGDRGKAVRFTFAAEELMLDLNNPDAGDATETLEIAGGPEIEIGFNAAYVLDALGHVAGDKACFAMSDPGAPAVVTGSQDGTLFVVMPMRVG